MLRNVNLQMHAMGKAYIKLKSVNVSHYPRIAECKSGLEDSRFLSSLEVERGGEPDMVVGEFVDGAGTGTHLFCEKIILRYSFREAFPD